MRSQIAALWAIGVLALVGSAEGYPWEWATTYDLQPGLYTWSFAKGESGAYLSPQVQMLILSVADSSNASLQAAGSRAETLWAGAATDKTSYQELDVDINYQLSLDSRTWATHFLVRAEAAGAYAVFLQPSPHDFKSSFPFFTDSSGAAVEAPLEQGGGAADEPQCPWGHEWEWSAVFPVQEGCYDWNAEKVDGAYADATMKILIMTAADERLGSLRAQASSLWGAIADDDELPAGGSIPLGEGRVLRFRQDTWASHYVLCVPQGTEYVAVFAQHFPIEFESGYHFLRSASGGDVEPVAEESVADCEGPTVEHSDLWAEVIGAAFVTGLPTLVGIVFVAKAVLPKIADMVEEGGVGVSAVHSFASGVIFAAAVFLLLPEGLHLVGVGKTEAGAAGMWGTGILSAWFLCVATKHIGQLLGVSSRTAGEKSVDWTVAVPILFGDAFHNLADGLVLGVAFKGCGPSFGWKLTLITVLHEAPQEISDFAILVTRARMHWLTATVFNFVSGLTSVVGAIITYAADVSMPTEGFVLAFGAGVYLYVAATELGPCVTELGDKGTWSGAATRLLFFALGATLIGLILLDHEHCVPESSGPAQGCSDDPHAGHNHR